MAGMFDSSAGLDPLSMLLLGGAAGLGQAGATSRLPISGAQAWGGLGAGLMAGNQAANLAQLQQQQASSEALKNALGLEAVRQQQAVMGQPIPTMQDIRSGKYQGLAPLFAKMYADQQQRLAAPTIPTPTAQQNTPSPTPDAQPADFLPPVYAPGSVAAKNIANNNPGNLKTADGGWMSFPDMPSGIEGIGNWLDRAQNVHGLTTVRQLIDDPVHGYAPSADPGNKGKMLPEVAANRIGVGPDDTVNLSDPMMREKMTRALLQQEQGGNALSKGRGIQLAQNVPQGQQSQPLGTSQQPQPDTSTPFDRLQAVMFERAQRSVAGLPLTPTEQMLMAAKLYPQGSSENKILMGQALKNSGIEPFKGGERPNAPLMEYDPQGAMNGQPYRVVQPPGYTQAVKERAEADARGRATVESQTVVDPDTGTPFATSRANAFAPGAPPIQTGLSPGAHAYAEAGGKAFFEPPVETFGPGGVPRQVPRQNLPGAFGPMATGLPAQGSSAPITPPAATTQPAQAPEAAAPAFQMNTPAGPKPVGQVHVNDMFPNGTGIPQEPQPPPGTGFGPPTEYQKDVQKDDATRVEQYNKEQSAAQKQYQDLLHLREVLNNGFNTSRAARIGADFANLAHAFGADWAYPRGWAPASAAEFDKASTDLVFAALKALPGQPRVSEITGLQKANPSLAIPRETNFNMMNDILASNKWQDERARLATEFKVANPGTPLSVFDSAYNRMAPLVDVTNEYKGVMRQHGAVFPEETPAGGAVAPAPTNRAALPKTATGPNGHKLYLPPGGSQWIDTVTGKPYVAPPSR